MAACGVQNQCTFYCLFKACHFKKKVFERLCRIMANVGIDLLPVRSNSTGSNLDQFWLGLFWAGEVSGGAVSSD